MPGWLRQVPDRGHDVHPAHAPGGQPHDHEGEEHADGVRNDDALWTHRVGDLEVACRSEGAGHDEHHQVGDSDPDERAERGREQSVGGPFEEEHLDEVAAPRADCTGDSELSPPLGREHHEDEEDQEQPGGDRERAKRRKEGHEGAPGEIGGLQRVRLRRLCFEGEP